MNKKNSELAADNTGDASVLNDLLCVPPNELGERLLNFLREIHCYESTPESCDVDDLLSLISQYVDVKKTEDNNKEPFNSLIMTNEIMASARVMLINTTCNVDANFGPSIKVLVASIVDRLCREIKGNI